MSPAAMIDPMHPAPRRGFAALTVVMVLFFVMALVAAYTNRNLIFEQRISANNYRAARALAAADAGVDWTLAMLNGGRVDINCQPSLAAGDVDFRSRYMSTVSLDAAVTSGGYEVTTWGAAPGTRLYPACINRDGVLNCICPTAATPTPAMAAPADGVGSSFRVSFWLPGNGIRPGTMEFAARGCASLGAGDTACYAPTRDTPNVDARSSALTTVGLVRALPLAPIATLTAGTVVDANAGDLRVTNADPATGLTVHAGDVITAPIGQFTGPAGSGSDGRQASDATLAALAVAADNGWFRALFGMDPATYQRQPAVVRVTCPAGGCTLDGLADVLAGHPRNPVWVDGNLTMATDRVLGSNADPLMLIVTGTVTVAANVQITGFVHANAVDWSAGAAAAQLRGALVSATRFTTSTVATLAYDKAVLDTIRLRYGSFVRVPSSWNLTTVN